MQCFQPGNRLLSSIAMIICQFCLGCSNRFFKTKPVTIFWKLTGNRITWCHVSHGCSPRKEGSQRSETQLCNYYVDSLPVVYSVTKRSGCRPVQFSCILLNFFHPWMAIKCGGINKASSSIWTVKMPDQCPLKRDQRYLTITGGGGQATWMAGRHTSIY